MNLLFRLVYAAHANGTHHKLALDALRHLQGPNGGALARILLRHHDLYLEGAKAPDKEFKDFKNHVCHTRDGYWGGAPAKAGNWYAHLVDAMRDGDWERAAYCAGVLSHYITDPLMPFHTAQSEAETNIHRAVEWSISRSYGELRTLARKRLPGPRVELADDGNWIGAFVRDSAGHANTYYEKLIHHYDFHVGVVDPEDGFDQHGRRIVAGLLSFAAVALARVLERALSEAAIEPPATRLGAATFVAGLTIPVHWVTRRLENAEERRLVTAMYDEFQATGRVEKTLPEENRVVRELYSREVLGLEDDEDEADEDVSVTMLNVPRQLRKELEEAFGPEDDEPADEDEAVAQADAAGLGLPAAGGAKGAEATDRADMADTADRDGLDEAEAANAASAGDFPAPDHANPREDVARYNLAPADDIAAAPSIGRKTARRLVQAGVGTVGDLLDTDPDELSDRMRLHYMTAETVAEWQDQARLVCTIPRLKAGAARLLVGAGYRDLASIAHAGTDELWAAVLRYAESDEGARAVRTRDVPSQSDVAGWIENAKATTVEQAA